MMENFGDQENVAKIEDVKQCPDCGNWMQLRDTGFGNAWAHVKADGRLEKLSDKCFPEDQPKAPRLGETLIVVDAEGRDRAALVCWAGAGGPEDEFTVFVLPQSVYSEAETLDIGPGMFSKVGGTPYTWRRP